MSKKQPKSTTPEDGGGGTTDNVIHLPTLEQRKQTVAEQLAGMPPADWAAFLPQQAKALGVDEADLRTAVQEILDIREQEKAAREVEYLASEKLRLQVEAARRKAVEAAENRAARAERTARQKENTAKADQRREERRTRKRVELFTELRSLPAPARKVRIAEWCKAESEDVDAVTAAFESHHADMLTLEREATAAVRPALEPWDQPVDGAALITELLDTFKTYIVMEGHQHTAVVFWELSSWLHNQLASHSPILAAISPEPDSGKTTMLSLISFLVERSYMSAELTGPALFHAVDQDQATILLDDADTVLRRRSDLAHIINHSHTRGAKIRRVGHTFHIFSPKALGLLTTGVLPPATASRCIFIKMWPSKPTDKRVDFDYAAAIEGRDEKLLELRRKQLRWREDNIEAIRVRLPTTAAPGLNNRVRMNWKLLFAIADQVGGEWPKTLRDAAMRLSEGMSKVSWGKLLLEALFVYFTEAQKKKIDWITSKELEEFLPKSDPDDIWDDYKGKKIKQRHIAHILRDYDIRSYPMHLPGGFFGTQARGYKLEQFEEKFEQVLQKKFQRPKADKPKVERVQLNPKKAKATTTKAKAKPTKGKR